MAIHQEELSFIYNNILHLFLIVLKISAQLHWTELNSLPSKLAAMVIWVKYLLFIWIGIIIELLRSDKDTYFLFSSHSNVPSFVFLLFSKKINFVNLGLVKACFIHWEQSRGMVVTKPNPIAFVIDYVCSFFRRAYLHE